MVSLYLKCDLYKKICRTLVSDCFSYLSKKEMCGLYFIAGAATNAILKTACDSCSAFLKRSAINEDEFQSLKSITTYTAQLTKAGLKHPCSEISELIFNCEIIHNDFRQLILHSNSFETLICKVVSDLEILFPACEHFCNLKRKNISKNICSIL